MYRNQYSFQIAILLPEVISKEPLGPVVRPDDPVWIEVALWTRGGILYAPPMR